MFLHILRQIRAIFNRAKSLIANSLNVNAAAVTLVINKT